MKDEYGRVIIDELLGLKSKMYSTRKINVVNLVLLKE